jgi:hypothetical protein
MTKPFASAYHKLVGTTHFYSSSVSPIAPQGEEEELGKDTKFKQI